MKFYRNAVLSLRTDQVTRRKTGWYYMYYIFGGLTGPNFRFRKARNGTGRVLYMNRMPRGPRWKSTWRRRHAKCERRERASYKSVVKVNLSAKTALLRPIEKNPYCISCRRQSFSFCSCVNKKIFLKQGLLKSINTMPLFRTLRLASFFPAFQPLTKFISESIKKIICFAVIFNCVQLKATTGYWNPTSKKQYLPQ